MRFRLVIFDFDGTLIDSAACITAALQRALLASGCGFDLTGVREQIGLPLQEIIREASPGISDAAMAAAIAAYRREYETLEGELITPFPGALDVVHRLHRGGVTLAIATNKLTARASGPLARYGIADRFAAIVGSDQVAHPKPHPDILHRVLTQTRVAAEAALMVGDTVWDIEMARRAGVASCAVTWGNHDAARLALARPSHTISRFAELADLVEKVESGVERN